VIFRRDAEDVVPYTLYHYAYLVGAGVPDRLNFCVLLMALDGKKIIESIFM